MTSPDRDITPLLSPKLPQLRLVHFPVYEVVDISVGIISHVHLLQKDPHFFSFTSKLEGMK